MEVHEVQFMIGIRVQLYIGPLSKSSTRLVNIVIFEGWICRIHLPCLVGGFNRLYLSILFWDDPLQSIPPKIAFL